MIPRDEHLKLVCKPAPALKDREQQELVRYREGWIYLRRLLGSVKGQLSIRESSTHVKKPQRR
jgi:hypothetical protein